MKKLWKRNMVAGAVLLLVCGAIFLNGRYAQQVEETDKILGQATLVDGTEGDAEEVSGEALPGDYFATARLTRQQARDSALSLLQEASGAAEVDEAAAAEAAQSIQTLAAYTLAEAQIENMITAKSDPVFGGVYKLAAVKEDDGSYTPKMKLSESAEKMTIPCLKKVWRIYDQDGKAMADLITMADEVVETQHGITLFDPIETWKECTYVNCTARCLSTPIYENGKRVYSSPSLDDIKKFCKAQVNTLWDEVKRFENPHRYYVDLSQKLWDTRSALLKKLSK